MPDTWTAMTPRGIHYFFKWEDKFSDLITNRVGLLPGVDLRGQGGYVAAPNIEPHRSWKAGFSPEEIPLAKAPQWLFDLLHQKNKQGHLSKAKGWITEALDGLRHDSHNRNDTFTRIVGKLHGGNVSKEDIFSLLLPHANRCQFDENELKRIIESISSYPTLQQRIVINANKELVSSATTNSQGLDDGGINFRPIFLSDLIANEEVERRWIWWPFMPEGAVILLGGLPKSGKTTFAYHLVRAIAKGTPFLGFDTAKRHVLILALEEHRQDVKDRCLALGIPIDSVIFHIGPLRAKFVEMKAIKDLIKTYNIGLVIVDTLARFWIIKEENNATEADMAMAPIMELARETEVGILLIHHVRKSPGDEGTEFRGSGDIFANVDAGIILKRRGDTKNQRELKIHSRYSDTPENIVISLEDGEYKVLEELWANGESEKETKILEALTNNPMLSEDIAQAAGVPGATVRRILMRLSKSGKVERYGKGKRGEPYTFAIHSSLQPRNFRTKLHIAMIWICYELRKTTFKRKRTLALFGYAYFNNLHLCPRRTYTIISDSTFGKGFAV